MVLTETILMNFLILVVGYAISITVLFAICWLEFRKFAEESVARQTDLGAENYRLREELEQIKLKLSREGIQIGN